MGNGEWVVIWGVCGSVCGSVCGIYVVFMWYLCGICGIYG